MQTNAMSFKLFALPFLRVMHHSTVLTPHHSTLLTRVEAAKHQQIKCMRQASACAAPRCFQSSAMHITICWSQTQCCHAVMWSCELAPMAAPVPYSVVHAPAHFHTFTHARQCPFAKSPFFIPLCPSPNRRVLQQSCREAGLSKVPILCFERWLCRGQLQRSENASSGDAAGLGGPRDSSVDVLLPSQPRIDQGLARDLARVRI